MRDGYGNLVSKLTLPAPVRRALCCGGIPPRLSRPNTRRQRQADPLFRKGAAIKLGQRDKARKLMADIRPGGQGNPEIILAHEEVGILQLELDAILALAEGEDEKALELLQEAVKQQTSMPFRYGPPRISKPTSELLGDVLMGLGRAEQASLAYQDQLSRTLLRTNSLLGLARATAQTGDATASREAYGALADIWHNADPALPALAEVKGQADTP